MRWFAALMLMLPFGAAAHPHDETVEVVGVVDGLGATASRIMDDPQWRGGVTLVAWRTRGGEVQTGELYLSKLLGAQREATLRFTDSMPSRTVVRLRLEGVPESSGTGFRGKIRDVIGPATDAQLADAAHAALNPLPYKHETLGTFTPWPRLPYIFEGSAEWAGRTIEVSLHGNRPAAGIDTLDDRARTATALLARQEDLEKSLNSALVREYYDIWVDGWRQPGEALLTKEQWLDRMEVTGIHAYAEGTFEITVSDGNLFSGHVLVVSGSLEAGITDVGLHG